MMRVSCEIQELPLGAPFVIARGARRSANVVRVEIRCKGVSGFGEAAPISRYDESADSARAYVDDVGPNLGDDPFAFDEVFGRLPRREFAARAAIDAALHDLQGKILGRPTWAQLGLPRVGPAASWTVSLGAPDEMAAAASAAQTRFKRLKLKLGGRDGLDADRVRAVAEVADVPLKVDVNEAWIFDEAVELLTVLADLGVELCEQPLAAGDPFGPKLKAGSPVPIYVDEDCHTLADVAEASTRAHGINVKLAKAGGIREASRMVDAARTLGLGCMIGCMVETGLGIAAATQIAGLFDHADLDGNLLLANDPWPIVNLIDGRQVPSDSPGLGTSQIVPPIENWPLTEELDYLQERFAHTVVRVAPVLITTRPEAEQLTQILPGEPIAVLENNSAWVRIETAYGYPGWVERRHLGGKPRPDWLQATVPRPVDFAHSLLGTPYLWGGMTRDGIDCSGLVHMSYRAAGRLVPRDAYQQEALGTPVYQGELLPGDLITYGAGSRAEHIAFWLGDGQIVHSTQRDGRNGVLVEDEVDLLRNNRRSAFRL
jgi:L-alanine-DL-glutamate epimerase-like enolase superfamily enzyme